MVIPVKKNSKYATFMIKYIRKLSNFTTNNIIVKKRKIRVKT